MDFFEKMTKKEKVSFLISAKVNLRLEEKLLKPDFVSILEKYWNEKGESFSEHDLNTLRKYSGKSVYCICDDESKGHYFILDEKNIVIPKECFK